MGASRASGGGGSWYAVSIDERGNVYAGIANPGPWGGSKAHPNGGSFPGPALYTDSLVVLAGATGTLLWYDQVTPHDVRDYDFQVSPILATSAAQRVVFGAGKGGRVVAWDRATHKRLWSRAVGTHLHDLGPLPRSRRRVCPGLLGGVETPMAYAGGRLFVPVVELCSQESAVTSKSAFARSPAQGKGTVYALAAANGKTALAAAARLGRRSAVRRSRATPSSFPPTTAASPRSRRLTAARSGTRNSPPATTAARPSARTCSSLRPERSIRGIAHPVTEVVAYSP